MCGGKTENVEYAALRLENFGRAGLAPPGSLGKKARSKARDDGIETGLTGKVRDDG